MSRSILFALACLVFAAAGCEVRADPAILYSNPAYESPVRGDPDDLLLIPGSGLSADDTVVYGALTNTNTIGAHPASIPTQTSFQAGVAPLVSAADAPYSLTVHLPVAMGAGQSYALWVVNASGEWSSPIRINDARPLWITPDFAYETASLAGLPRVLKVIGRNLQPNAATNNTYVRLSGLSTGAIYTLPAKNTNNDAGNTTAALERYTAVVDLPVSMASDRYSVQVSRDGVSWVSLMGNSQSFPQIFTVDPDPVPPTPGVTFDVSDPRFADPSTGAPCQPDDGLDDTGCILLAVRAAQAAGGGTVTFGPGKWLMTNVGDYTDSFSNRIGLVGNCAAHRDTCGVTWYGVVVPVGVNLQGAGASGANPATIERGTGWPGGMVMFCLLGNNSVSGIRFTDDNSYSDTYNPATQGGAPLSLGMYQWYRATFYDPNDPVTVSHVVITHNVFAGNNFGIRNGGLPADHIYITNNTFGTWDTGIFLDYADPTANLGPMAFFQPYEPYNLADSAISYNTFYPSGYTTAAGAGAIATNISGGLRTDFSNNLADGTATQYLAGGPSGWRAAFFMNPAMGHDMTLVSSNSASCTGDKNGDGEFIVYDGGTSLGGMPYAEPVTFAAPWADAQGVAGTTLTVQGPIQTQLPSQTGQTIDISSNPTAYYSGYWLQVVQGMGKGQWRKVKALSVGSNPAGPMARVSVTPAFDVLPDASSRVILGRAYWQNATVNNSVVQTSPTCTKANPRRSGGIISFYGSTADSAIEGNSQYDTSGIFVRHAYLPVAVGPAAPATMPQVASLALQSSNEVRNNLVSGTYDWSGPSDRTPTGLLGMIGGGIQVGFAATGWFCAGNTCPAPVPPGTGFGITIAGNTIINASGRDVDGSVHPPIGAIGLNPGWETGPTDALGLDMWQLGEATLIFNNSLQGISNSTPGAAGGQPLIAIGLDVAQGSTLTPAVTWRTTLYNNSCLGADSLVATFGLATVRYCPAGHAATCECAGMSSVDVGIAVTSSASTSNTGGSATYTIVVSNNDAVSSATDVNLLLEPSAGVQIVAGSFAPGQGTCDPSVNVCMLGSLAAGQSTTVFVTGKLPQSGTWPITFSVTHREADGAPTNDSVTLTELVQ